MLWEWWCYENVRVTWYSWHLWHVWPVSRSRAMASVTRSAPGNLWSITRLLLPRDENRSQHTGHLLRTRAMMTLYSKCLVFFSSHRHETNRQSLRIDDLTMSWRETLVESGDLMATRWMITLCSECLIFFSSHTDLNGQSAGAWLGWGYLEPIRWPYHGSGLS